MLLKFIHVYGENFHLCGLEQSCGPLHRQPLGWRQRNIARLTDLFLPLGGQYARQKCQRQRIQWLAWRFIDVNIERTGEGIVSAAQRLCIGAVGCGPPRR